MPHVRGARQSASRVPGEKPVIQSGARIVRLISLLIRTPNGYRLSDLSSELALPKPTVLRLLQTLVGEGIAVKDPTSGLYRMNSLFWLVVAVSLPDARWVQREVQETLEWLARTSSATALLVIPTVGMRRMTVRASALPDHPLVACPSKSASAPMHAVAAGKCYLASLPDDVLRAWLQGDLPRVTEKTITSPEALLKEVVQVRERGYAVNREELAPGCWGLAVPVYDASGDLVGALELAAPLTLPIPESVPRWLPLLQRAATRLSSLIAPGASRPARRGQAVPARPTAPEVGRRQ